jgi:hypothetical protein
MRRIRFAIVVGLPVLAVATHPAPLAAQSYAPVGPQTSVPMSTVLTGGWTRCFSSDYGSWLGPWLPAIEEGCAGDRLMLACAAAASDTLNLLAQATETQVYTDPGTEPGDSHLANGAQWYFSPSGSGEEGFSWGFAGVGDAVQRNNCDVEDEDGAQRLCWHLNPDSGGYRCGSTEELNQSSDFVKILYTYGTAIFADGFELGDACDWGASLGDEECSQAIALSLGPVCGGSFVDQGAHDLDPDPDEIGYRYSWTHVRGETGYRVQISHGASFGAEDDYVELAAGVLETPVLHCEFDEGPNAPTESSSVCDRVVRVMAHVGHAPGHGAATIEGDLWSNTCALVPQWDH